MNTLTYNYALGTRHNNLSTHELRGLYNYLQLKESETIADLADVRYSIKKIHEELINRNMQDNTVIWPYIDAPYFTEEERMYYVNEHQHRNNREHYANFHRVDPSIYRNRVQEIQTLMKNTEDPEELMRLKNELIKLGWNPEVECNEANMLKAKKRILNIYNTELNENCVIINSIDEVSNFSNNVLVMESHSDNIPVNIIIFEDHISIQPNNLDCTNESGDCDIYTIYVPESFNVQQQIVENNNDRIFNKISTNYIAMKVVKEHLNIPYKTIIHKVYTGDISKANINSINNYNHTMVNQ
jgi:hypothetical protein